MAHLQKLPLEIFQHIASFLPTGSAASLALCSHALMLSLGRQYWFRLREEREQRRQFLRYIERNTPGFYFCHCCVKLHPLKAVPRLGRSRKATSHAALHGGCFSAGGHLALGPLHDIEYTHVQLALSRYRWGSEHGIDLGQLTLDDPKYHLRKARHLTITPRIVNSELILKVQHIFFFKDEAFDNQLENQWIEFCPHDSWWNVAKSPSSVPLLLQCKDEHKGKLAEAACLRCLGLRKCSGCHTDFLVRKNGTEYVVNLWKNLGSGQSPTDAKWLTHVRDWGSNNGASFRPCTFELGSIRAAWESQGSIESHS
ncbi:MAG: hypothetical protein MMC33_008091 [Icmadophila ericetorum]|nr:hypothetical protein [Icmadophila ericetorum]